MKIKNKQIVIILVSVAVLFSTVGYVVLGQDTYEVQGYRVLYDQAPPAFSAISTDVTYRTYSTTIKLPSDVCSINSTVLSYGFSGTGIEKGDVNKDGKIDWVDLYIMTLAYQHASSGMDTPFTEEKCFYVVGDQRFEDPTRDYNITADDLAFVNTHRTTNSNPYSADCDSRDECKADVNKDGKVDLIDLILVAKRLSDPYPDFCMSFSDYKPRDADTNGDGTINVLDMIISASSFGAKANQQKITQATVQDLGSNTYSVSATGYNIYHVDLAYDCSVPYTSGGGSSGQSRPV